MEYKFRAWNKEKEIMVYNDEDDTSCYWDGVNLSDVEMVNARLEGSSICPYIWEQFIGQKDKNGQDIYAGDIVRHLYGFGNGKGIVEYWPPTWKLGHKKSTCDEILFRECEIIGNIHQHPELLNKE